MRVGGLNGQSAGDAPLTVPEPRREHTGPFLTAVLQMAPAFVPPDAALANAFELPDLSVGSATYTTGNYTAYVLTVQRHSSPPDLGEVIPAAVRIEQPSGSTRYDATGSDYLQVILSRPSGVVVNVSVPFLGELKDQQQALANLASQVTEMLDVPSTDLIGLPVPDQRETHSG